MLSITDLLDFIDLDIGTIEIVSSATQLPAVEATVLARQLLATTDGLMILHHMFRDQIANAVAQAGLSQETELRRAYAYFSRKYPIPQMTGTKHRD